jgi:hypothetical protein
MASEKVVFAGTDDKVVISAQGGATLRYILAGNTLDIGRILTRFRRRSGSPWFSPRRNPVVGRSAALKANWEKS